MDQLVTTVREQQWLAMLKAQKSSGLSISSWCRENGVSENCFYYRQQKLRQRIGSALPRFVEIKPPVEKPAEASHLENIDCAAIIQLRSGAILSLSNHASSELIRNIVEALHVQ